MEFGVLAVRYSKALLAYAEERGCADAIYSAAAAAVECFCSAPGLCRTLDDPMIGVGEKTGLLLTACGLTDDSVAAQVLSRFFTILAEHRREGYTKAIFLSYRTLYREKHNLGVAKITTAVPLDSETERKILERASLAMHKSFEIVKTVDPEIEGGFILDIDDVRLDASVATQIERIKKQLLEKNKRIV